MKNYISIIIPVYNSENGIKDTLDSINEQTYLSNYKNNLEVIVVDNNSNDNTYDIANSYSSQMIKVYKQDLIQGSYASRNFGVSKAKGTHFLFIDADVILSKNVLDLVFTNINKLNIDYCGFNVIMKLNTTSLSSKINFLRGFNVKRNLKFLNYTPTCALLTSRQCFESVNGFENLESGGDLLFGQKTHNNKYKQMYFDNIKFYHPTRADYKSLISKSNRVARGHAQLAIYDPGNYKYLYLRHFNLSNFRPKNPFTFLVVFKKNKLPISLLEFFLVSFFHIPISVIRLFHVKKYYNTLSKSDSYIDLKNI